MLGFKDASAAKQRVQDAQEVYCETSKHVVAQCEQLNELRLRAGTQVVADFETYISKLASSPKSYERTVELYSLNHASLLADGQSYSDMVDVAIQKAAIGGGATAGLGAAAGAATALGAPTAAMAVAMTFGTASTGTAISALTGAAATNAALAWLGGGALAAGGGGMSGGSALLALAGPVGWALAGGTLLAGAGYAWWKNINTSEEADALWQQLSEATGELARALTEVSGIYGLTAIHTSKLRSLLDGFEVDAPSDYQLFSERQKEALGAMHNNVLALARLLKLKPGETVDLMKPVEDSEVRSARFSQQSGPAYVPNFTYRGQHSKLDVSEAHISIASLLKRPFTSFGRGATT